MTWLILGAGICGNSLASYFKESKQEYLLYDDNKGLEDHRSLEVTRLLPKRGFGIAFEALKDKKTKIILSPGICKEHPLLIEAKRQRRTITCEADLALQNNKAKIIAVTGTNGKSTVVSMCQHILQKLGKQSALLGNIGTPLSSLLIDENKPQYIVAELSSYQLEQMEYKDFYCSIITNFAEDHLERHKSLKEYFRVKSKIFQTEDNKESCGFWSGDLEKSSKRYGFFSKKNMPIKKVKTADLKHLVPKHLCWPEFNLYNACLALKACAFATKEPIVKLAEALASFKTIPHRFQPVAQTKDTLIINDSKATNVDATEAALKSLDKKTIVMLGGLSKSADFKPLTLNCKNISTIVAFGKARDKIAEAFANKLPVSSHETLSSAIENIKKINDKDHASYILFSPACASFDEFDNFSQRGDFFTNKIKTVFKEDLV